MMPNKGRYDGGRLLSRPSVELMTTDHLAPAQKAGNEIFLGSGGWGFGVAVDGHRDDLATRPGRSAGPAAWAPRPTPIRRRTWSAS